MPGWFPKRARVPVPVGRPFWGPEVDREQTSVQMIRWQRRVGCNPESFAGGSTGRNLTQHKAPPDLAFGGGTARFARRGNPSHRIHAIGVPEVLGAVSVEWWPREGHGGPAGKRRRGRATRTGSISRIPGYEGRQIGSRCLGVGRKYRRIGGSANGARACFMSGDGEPP